MRWTTRCVVAVAGLGLLTGCGEETTGSDESAAEAPASSSPAPATEKSTEPEEETSELAAPSTVTVTETTDGEAAPDSEAAPSAEPSSQVTEGSAEPAPEQTTETPPEPSAPADDSSTPAEEPTPDEEPTEEPTPDEQEVDLEAARAELAEIGGPYVEVALLPGNPETGSSGLFGLTADDEENVVFWKRDVNGWRQIDDSKHPGTVTEGVTASILPVTVQDAPLFLVEGQFRQNGEAGTLLYGFADGRGIVPLQLRGDRLQPADDDSMTDPTLFASAKADEASEALVTTRLDLEAGLPMVELGKYPPIRETWAGAGDHLRLQGRTGGVPEEERRG